MFQQDRKPQVHHRVDMSKLTNPDNTQAPQNTITSKLAEIDGDRSLDELWMLKTFIAKISLEQIDKSKRNEKDRIPAGSYPVCKGNGCETVQLNQLPKSSMQSCTLTEVFENDIGMKLHVVRKPPSLMEIWEAFPTYSLLLGKNPNSAF